MGKLSKVNNGGRERGKWANSSLKKGRGIYTPPGIVAVAVLQGRIFWSKFGPDNPPPPPRKSAKDFARVVQIWGRIIRPDISIFGWIIRPPDYRPKFGPDNPARKSKQYENSDNFCIRTPFSMILGLLESPQQGLQLNP
jgi:hypothetical protein